MDKRNPLHYERDYPTLVCKKCGHTLVVPRVPISWPDEEYFYQPDRFHNLIKHSIAKHKCTTETDLPFELLPRERRCSGYKVFPNGSPCGGCGDCRNTDHDPEEEAKAYNTIMANQTYLDEIEIKPAQP